MVNLAAAQDTRKEGGAAAWRLASAPLQGDLLPPGSRSASSASPGTSHHVRITAPGIQIEKLRLVLPGPSRVLSLTG